MDDQRTERNRWISMIRRILKWLTIAAWALTLYMLVSTGLQKKYGDSLGYGVSAEVTVILAQLALFPTFLYAVAIAVEKSVVTHKQE